MRTYNTAAIYYHKFRLVHKETEYAFVDAAAAALFTACKIEDTLKKSREILCAAHNLRVTPAEYLTPDDSIFEAPSKAIIGLERLMLEASGFDYRNRYPQKYLFKLAKKCHFDKDVVRTGYRMMLDLYRTFAPLRSTSAAMAFACLELATRIMDKQQENWKIKGAPKHGTWMIYRHEIMEIMLDLLDLYTHFQKSSIIGPLYPIDTFINVRIALNQECEERKFARHTVWKDLKQNGMKANIKTPKTPITPVSPSDHRTSPATLSPRSSGSGRRGAGTRGQDGTVRFMLEASQAKREMTIVNQYFQTEYEEYEEEVEEPIRPATNDYRHRDVRDDRNGRNDRYERDFKRPRR